MKVLSVQIGLPKMVDWEGKQVFTGIFKERTKARVRVHAFHLEGDGVGDPKVHGGEFKSLYSFASEFYPSWDAEMGRRLEPGSFGENLTTQGLDESQVRVGDRFRIGTALLEASEPRMPCYKQGIRLGDPAVVKSFLAKKQWGVYFRVIQEGELGEGDEILRESQSPIEIMIPEIAELRTNPKPDRLRLALKCPGLSPTWRARFEKALSP